MKTSPSEYLQKPMKSPLSADDLEVLLFCYLSSSRHPRFSTHRFKESVEMFKACYVLLDGHDPDTYTTSKKGAALVYSLLQVKEPRLAWVDRYGEMVDPDLKPDEKPSDDFILTDEMVRAQKDALHIAIYEKALKAVIALDEHEPSNVKTAKVIAEEALSYVIANLTKITEPKLETES